MNHWTKLSIEFANQRNYLDELFRVYPCIPENIREIDDSKWEAVEKAFKTNNKIDLIQSLLRLKLFLIKDSYVAYLRRDKGSIRRNPATVDRLCGRIYELGLNGVYSRCSEPKEMNRQIGPLSRRWLQKKELGVELLDKARFLATKDNAILSGSDSQLLDFARQHLNYSVTKGLDFIGRFNKNMSLAKRNS